MKLTDKHIEFIKQDLESRGLIHEGLRDEIVDHVCSLVERKMEKEVRFIEAYRSVLKEFGGTKTLWKVQSETLKLENYKTPIMLRNYLKIAYRNITRHKSYSFINVLGLSIGITCCILIMLYVKSELSYDKYLPNSKRIYRVASNHLFHGNPFHAAITPAPLASALSNDFPEVEIATRLRNGGSIVFRKGESAIKEPSFAFADSTFFNVFQFKILEGNPGTALVKPNSIVLSESTAKKFFGNESAIGKTLITSDGDELLITAVMEDILPNTHFQIPLFISMSSFSRANNDNWHSNNFHTYFLLREGSDAKSFEGKLRGLVEKYFDKQFQESGSSLEEAEASGSKANFELQPLNSIHLHSDLIAELGSNGDILYIYIFSSIAIFILLIACFNFMNMSTARSSRRAKEVGVRKVLGSYRSHLIRQFLAESILLSVVACLMALGMTWLSLPYFNDLALKDIRLPITDPSFILIMVLLSILIGVVAGFYPSLFLSAFKPSSVLKGATKSGSRTAGIRSILVVFQFVISVVLILGTLVIYKQLNFIQSKKLGFEKDHILVVRNAYLLDKQLQSFKNELLSESIITSASLSSYLPVGGSRGDNTYFPKGNMEIDRGVNMQVWYVDDDYIHTFGMEMVLGRNFSQDFPSDASAYIINERAAEAFGFDNPLGKIITEYYWDPKTGSMNTDSLIHHEIIGVVRNFHFSSLRNTIGPLSLRLGNSAGSLSLKFNSSNTSQLIDMVKRKWEAMAPGQPFEFYFADEQFNRLYSSEQRMGKIFGTFATLAIFVACLGLFALSAYTSEQRTKEIGVRKVLGASVSSIIILLSKEFGRLVAIAFVIAIPIAWYGMSTWLNQFAYKTAAGITTYFLAGIIALFVAFVAMSFQSIRAARTNPVDSLRSE